MMSSPRPKLHTEWPTLAALLGCYGAWMALLFLPLWIAVPGLALAIALQSSLQHEVIHGHPTKWPWVNAALVLASLNLLIPFGRFRDMHLAHHKDACLTDPYDDPETNYLDPARWEKMPRLGRWIFLANGTLAGRLLLGALISQVYFMLGDWHEARAGDRRVLWAWVIHVPACALVVVVLIQAEFPIWAYLIAAYGGLSLLKIRTYAEHRAHEDVGARTAVVEDRGLLAFLFLNNNFHAVHHLNPQIAWYALPAFYRAQKDKFLQLNHGYIYQNYGQLFRHHLFRRKDPVPHPLWSRDK